MPTPTDDHNNTVLSEAPNASAPPTARSFSTWEHSRPVRLTAWQPECKLAYMAILFSAHTDVGRVREQNEDNYLVDRKLQLYLVCDGMGGHLSGEVATSPLRWPPIPSHTR